VDGASYAAKGGARMMTALILALATLVATFLPAVRRFFGL
jgi:hypothetical protein